MRATVLGLLAIVLTACALPVVPENAGNTRVAAWSPVASPRAVVIALHGFNDHKASFTDFGAFAAAHGVAVEAYDQAGFGTSRAPGVWAGTNTLVADLHAAVHSARMRHPGVPVHLLGESMGAAVAVAALARPDAPQVDGLILSAPAVWGGETMPRHYRLALDIVATLLPPLKVSGGGLGILASDNLDMLRALGRDPLVIKETRVGAIAGLVRLMDEARALAPRLQVPMLILRGARDQVVTPTVQASFVRQVRAAPCTTVTYVNGWHLLLRDLQRERVFADVLGWIESGQLPSGLAVPCRREAEPVEATTAGALPPQG